MRIGIIGGPDRSARELEDVARARGHELATHTGVIAGKGAASSLRGLVARSHLVVILTDINNHNAVRMARRVARSLHVPVRILRRLGPTQLAAYLHALEPAVAEPEALRRVA